MFFNIVSRKTQVWRVVHLSFFWNRKSYESEPLLEGRPSFAFSLPLLPFACPPPVRMRMLCLFFGSASPFLRNIYIILITSYNQMIKSWAKRMKINLKGFTSSEATKSTWSKTPKVRFTGSPCDVYSKSLHWTRTARPTSKGPWLLISPLKSTRIAGPILSKLTDTYI